MLGDTHTANRQREVTRLKVDLIQGGADNHCRGKKNTDEVKCTTRHTRTGPKSTTRSINQKQRNINYNKRKQTYKRLMIQAD